MRTFERTGGRCSVPGHGPVDTGTTITVSEAEAHGFSGARGWSEVMPETETDWPAEAMDDEVTDDGES